DLHAVHQFALDATFVDDVGQLIVLPVVRRANSRSAQALREKSSFVTTVRSFKRGDFQSLASRGNSASARSSRKVSCM
ncbi:MAG: hypothetical protein WCC77_27145, partial [Pseudolabrys sp.]